MSERSHTASSQNGLARDDGTPIEFAVRAAQMDDIDAVKRLADAHRREIGFVIRASLVDACRRGELLVAVTRGPDLPIVAASPIAGATIIGFVQSYFRKDGQTTLHTIAVDAAYRRLGIGRALVSALIDSSARRGMRSILLRCPIGLAANTFYAAIGFVEERIEDGKRQQLRVWTYINASPFI